MLTQIENIITEYTMKVFNCDKKDMSIINRFHGGMSNYTYKIKVFDKYFVFRVLGEGANYLINREHESFHLKEAYNLGITPKTIYFDIATGIKISEYIEGNLLANDYNHDDLIELASTLKRLHSSNITAFEYTPIKRLSEYERLLKRDLSSTYYTLKEEWLNLYNTIYYKYKRVFTHGDAQRSNIVKNNDGKIYLLDWEFAGLNDPYYDIASFGNISFTDSIKLLEVYLNKKPNNAELNHLRFMRMYQVLQWHVVATFKHEIKLSEKLNLNFDVIAKKYLDFAKELFDLMKENYE